MKVFPGPESMAQLGPMTSPWLDAGPRGEYGLLSTKKKANGVEAGSDRGRALASGHRQREENATNRPQRGPRWASQPGELPRREER